MFKNQSQPNKVGLLRKLREIFMPSTISLREPIVQKNTRGRPSLKDKLSRSFHFTFSTQEPPRHSYHDTSKFDDVDISRYQARARHSCYVSGYQAPTSNVEDKNLYKTEDACEIIEFHDQFEPILQPYIMEVQDVKPDGNCGFRAISVCLGFNEDNWPNIRRELLEELNLHREEYEDMFNPSNFAQVGASLSWFYRDRFAPIDYWLSMPEMGVLIASKYNRILHVLNITGSSTYLPLRSTPTHWTKHSSIAIGYVNGNHYVRVMLEGGYPIPTISHHWLRWRYPCAIGWATPYQSRIKRYTDYLESKGTVDHVVLDE